MSNSTEIAEVDGLSDVPDMTRLVHEGRTQAVDGAPGTFERGKGGVGAGDTRTGCARFSAGKVVHREVGKGGGAPVPRDSSRIHR